LHYLHTTTDGGEGSPFAPQPFPELEHPIKYPVGLVCCYLCLQALLIVRQLPGSNQKHLVDLKVERNSTWKERS